MLFNGHMIYKKDKICSSSTLSLDFNVDSNLFLNAIASQSTLRSHWCFGNPIKVNNNTNINLK